MSEFFRRLFGPNPEEALFQLESAKWNSHLQALERLLFEEARELSVAECTSRINELRTFWKQAEKDLRMLQWDGHKWSPTARAMQHAVTKADSLIHWKLDPLAKLLHTSQAVAQFASVDEVTWNDVRMLEGIIDFDPLNERSQEDFGILESLATGKAIPDDYLERHKFLLRYSRSFQAMHRGDLPIEAQAQRMLFTWKQTGFDIEEAREQFQHFFHKDDEPASASNGSSSELPRPEPRLIRNPRDAELVAVDWMRFWGLGDARATPVGADEGIDVASETAIAQVKAHMVPVGRPDVQNLAGVAATEKKMGIFFALNGYTPQAIAWADRADIVLFSFDLQGEPEAINVHARRLME